jgi:CO/xanthine dehydrogenase FAD-binding subunit
MKIPMLERPLRVLDALARGPAGPSELARQTQLPKATVLRILSFLQQRNYAERTAQATWRPGPATLAPAEAWRALAPLPQLAQPLLAELAAATQESAALHLRLADTRLIAARADSPRRVRDLFALGEHLPLMHEALQYVGHRQTRNRGTIGGSLCHLDPAAELPTVSAAYDAVVEIVSDAGAREIPFDEFPLGYLTPSLEPGEMVRAIRFPLWPKGAGSAFVEFARRQGDFAIVSVAALLLFGANGKVERASLTLGGVGTGPLRMYDVESALVGDALTVDAINAASQACGEIEVDDDPYTPAHYRKHLCRTLVARALETAAMRAGWSRS